MEDRARDAGAASIRLEVNETNTRAMEFYAGHGFVPGERIDYMRIVMVKGLR